MNVRYPDSCLIQFAKAPLYGQVKTRLEPKLGKSACLELHQALVEHQFHLQQLAAHCHFEIWCSGEHDFFKQLASGTEVPVCLQQGNDLGERMYGAFVERLQQYSQVILIGSDCPDIDVDYVCQALDLLDNGAPAVFGPAHDGGYVLIGLSQIDRSLFDGVLWGSDKVMDQTRQRLQGLGWAWKELPPLADIDRPEDLKHLSGFTKLHIF